MSDLGHNKLILNTLSNTYKNSVYKLFYFYSGFDSKNAKKFGKVYS